MFTGDNYRLATVVDGEAHTRELLVFSHGVAADEGGRTHITSQYGPVRTYEPEQRVLRTRAEKLDRPTGLAVRSDASLVVAETGAGRVVAIDDADTLVVLADGLTAPVDVAVDDGDRCYVSDEQVGMVSRIADRELVPVAEELNTPQGLTVFGDELFVVETGLHRLLGIALATGECRVEAAELPVGLPPGVTRAQPDLHNSDGLPGVPVPFSGVAAGTDGSLFVAANGEGSVLHLRRVTSAPGSTDRSPANCEQPRRETS